MRAPETVLCSSSHDPYWNLAVEEQLLDQAANRKPVLFLWQSRPAVVIGKHQNPWRECHLPWMQENDVWLARRHTGGGAVYHDDGNLNFAYFMPRVDYEAETVFGWVESALVRLGIHVSRMNRTSLAVPTGKLSGNAFCFRRNGAQHHGTLLVHADLDRVEQALQAPDWTFDTRATASIRARVTNVASVRPDITVQDVIDVLCAGRPPRPVETMIDMDAAHACAAERRGPDWLYGKTPPFRVTVDGQSIDVKQGRVTDVEPCDDKENWIGQCFKDTPLFANSR